MPPPPPDTQAASSYREGYQCRTRGGHRAHAARAPQLCTWRGARQMSGQQGGMGEVRGSSRQKTKLQGIT